jgi:V8-like Glu-specific endopeptidase
MATATRSTRRARTSAAKAGPPPLTVDELVPHDNVPAELPVPDEIADQLRRHAVHVTLRDGRVSLDPAEVLVPDRELGKGVWRLTAPEDAIVGLPGRTAVLEKRSSARSATTPAAQEAFRPSWVDHVYHPKLSGLPPQAAIRRLDGKLVQPYYGVYPPDDRRIYYPTGYPWHCIGRVFTWTDASNPSWSFYGSGVLIGGRLVLTAGHMVPWGSPSWKMLFVPGYYDGQSVNGPGAQSWVSDCRGWNTGGSVAAHDMAVCRLYTPLGGWLGYLGARSYSSDWEDGPYWTLCGYPSSITGGARPSYQSGIPVLDDDSDWGAEELEHHGDATPGDSGGPFFGFWNDGPYAIGTTSGGERIFGTPFGWWDEDNNIEAGGAAMVDLVRWGRQNWA